MHAGVGVIARAEFAGSGEDALAKL